MRPIEHCKGLDAAKLLSQRAMRKLVSGECGQPVLLACALLHFDCETSFKLIGMAADDMIRRNAVINAVSAQHQGKHFIHHCIAQQRTEQAHDLGIFTDTVARLRFFGG